MKTTTIIATVSADRLANLSIGEVTTHAEAASAEFASYAEKGCKYLGLLRGVLQSQGMKAEETFGLVKKGLLKGGMDPKRAKSQTNNGNGHAALALFLLPKDGIKPICEQRFYAVPVGKAKEVAATLRKGGAEAIDAFNKLRLTKGKLSKKSLAAFLPNPGGTDAAEVKAAAATRNAISEAEENATPSEEVAAELSPLEIAAKGIALLKKSMPKLNDSQLDDVKSEIDKHLS